MPSNISRTASFYDKEVLKYGVSLDGNASRSVVLDATDTASWTVSAGERTVVPAGTILKLSATNANRVVKYDGTGTIFGVLARPVDVLANTTAGLEPAPAWFHGVVFSTKAVVGFTTYASALVNTLTTCKFE